MIRQLIRLALRNLKRQKSFTTINVISLSIGLLTFSFIFIYSTHELSFDKFHSKSDRIFRLITARDGNVGAFVPYKWGDVLRSQWSEAEQIATIQKITIALTVKHNDEVFAQHGFIGADTTFFDIFDFPIIEGNRQRFLKTPNQMVITPGAAKKYFGDQNPIGKTLQVSLWGTYVTYEIQGIVRCPPNSHLQFEFVIPMHFVRRHFFSSTAFDSWTTRFAYTYILMNEADRYKNNREEIRSYFKDFLEQNGGDQLRNRFSPDLEPLEDIYLKSDLEFDFPPRGSDQNVKILLVVGIGILLMAIFNFVNITTAQNLRRIKEIGLKKILGSSRKMLITQLLIESIVLALLALLVVILLILLLLPIFNDLTGKSFTPFSVFDLYNALLLVGITIIVGIVAGAYPALLITSLRPTSILGSKSKVVAGNSRKYLVILQFIVAVLLLGGTGVVYRQVTYMQNKDLGFNKDQVIAMQDVRVIASNPLKTDLFRQAVLKSNKILSVSASSSSPGQVTWGAGYIPDGFEENEKFSISTIYADHDFGKTYDLEILSGRDFDRSFISDSTSFLINEAALRAFAAKDASWLKNPINKKIKSPDFTGSVIGVVKDFHLESLHEQIDPLVISIDPSSFFNIQIKVESDNMVASLEHVESTWKKLFPEIPFTYTFVDQEFAQLFESDQKMKSLLGISTVISILIAVLGLLGLTSFQVFEKAKEISIRKVVGASEPQLFTLQAWNFLKLVLIANLIALPLNFYIMNEWLSTFAYRIEIPTTVFIFSAIMSLVISLITIFYHVLKVSRINPAEVLATE